MTVTLGLTGTATLGTDYTTPPAVSQPISPTPPPTIVIPAGSLTGTLVLTAVQDALDELDETVVADIAAVTNGTESGTQQATATITDDDPHPSFNRGAPPPPRGCSAWRRESPPLRS